MALAQRLQPRQVMGVSPALVASVELLGLRPAELAEAVARELDDNPALILDERGRRPGLPHDGNQRQIGEPADRPSDAARLLRELRLMTAARDHAVAEYIVGSLDDRGYLDADPGEIASELGVARSRVDRVVTALRACGPPGIAARDLRDCLALQLDRRGIADPILRGVIESHLPALAAGRYGAIAAALGTSREDVVRALAITSARICGRARASTPPTRRSAPRCGRDRLRRPRRPHGPVDRARALPAARLPGVHRAGRTGHYR